MSVILSVVELLTVCATCVWAQTTPDSLPNFVVEPQDTIVQAGRTARLECQVSSLADNQDVAWMKETTFQTSGGESLLTTDPEKLSRISVENGIANGNLYFTLFIHNVQADDAGIYHCYIVEFSELNQRRWSRSRPAKLAVVEALKPSVRCNQPTEGQLSLAVNQSQPASVGCTTINNLPGMIVKLQNTDGNILLENKTDKGEPYDLNFLMDVVDLRTKRLTCIIEFRDPDSATGEAVRSCSMGPFIEVPPAENRTRITVDVVLGIDAHLHCPTRNGRRGDASLERPSWAFEPKLPASRYSFSPDGTRITISHIAPHDQGLLISCSVSSLSSGRNVVDMEVRVKNQISSPSVSRPDLRGQPVHQAGGNRDRVAPRPVIGQAAWSVLRSEDDSGRIKPAPSTRPSTASETIQLLDIAGGLLGNTLAPGTQSSVNGLLGIANGTSTPSLSPRDTVSETSPVSDQPSSSLSPLVIVALCEAGMSIIILAIAFAVLCQCCCRNQTKGTVRGDKDLNLATASFGKQSTTPTLLTYKSTSNASQVSVDIPKKHPLPPDVIDAREESRVEGANKTVLRASDLPPTGSWVFSSVNSENGEEETNTRETGNAIYVTMV